MKPKTKNQKPKRVISKNEKETTRIAGEFAKKLKGGEVVLLEGELGTGKTTFTRGMARAFGIHEPVRSPTFTLMHCYQIPRITENQKPKTKYFRSSVLGIRSLCHVDAYRLRGPKDLRDIGIEEYIGKKDTIVVIEWGEKVKGLFSKLQPLRIKFSHGKNINERIILWDDAQNKKSAQ